MRKKEQLLWDRTRPQFKQRGWFVERIENLVDEGTPDTHFAPPEGLPGWLELKAVHDWPKRSTTRVIPSGKGMSVDQRNWFLEYLKHPNARAFILVGVGSTQFLFNGIYADRINDFTRDGFERYAVWTWPMIFQRLAFTEGTEK